MNTDCMMFPFNYKYIITNILKCRTKEVIWNNKENIKSIKSSFEICIFIVIINTNVQANHSVYWLQRQTIIVVPSRLRIN